MEEKKRWPLAYAPNSFFILNFSLFPFDFKSKSWSSCRWGLSSFRIFSNFFFVCAKKPKDWRLAHIQKKIEESSFLCGQNVLTCAAKKKRWWLGLGDMCGKRCNNLRLFKVPVKGGKVFYYIEEPRYKKKYASTHNMFIPLLCRSARTRPIWKNVANVSLGRSSRLVWWRTC